MSIYDGHEKKGIYLPYDSDDTLWDKIKYKYYDIVPYNWRPSQIWYRLKCRLWKKYTTYKPRYLSHTWNDRDNILLHMNFEILCQFIEKECSPGYVNWAYDEFHIEKMREMRSLYDWWIDCHTDRKKDDILLDKRFDELYKVYEYLIDEADGPTETIPLRGEDYKIYAYKWETSRTNPDKFSDYVKARNNLSHIHEEFLERQLIRLIKIRPFMWT